MTYLWHILIMINLYAVLAASLNLAVGYTGLSSMCHAAFYGIGAYAATLLMTEAGLGFFPSLALAVVVTAALSLTIAVPSLRLKGDYFVLATLSFQVIVVTTLYNWVSLTRGLNGIPGIPVPSLFGIEFDTPPRYLVFSGVLTAASLLVIWLLVHSPYGRLLRAIREDETAAAAVGKNVTRIKTTAFVIAAATAAVPGALFAGYVRYIDPTTFTLTESIFILSVVVIGGAGNFWGPVVGAVFMVLLPEALRFLDFSYATAANLRQVVYGLLLILLMRLRPQGLMGEYKFE